MGNDYFINSPNFNGSWSTASTIYTTNATTASPYILPSQYFGGLSVTEPEPEKPKRPKPKPPTAFEWMRAQVDEVVALGYDA